MHPYSLEAIFKPFLEVTKDIALFLPRTSDLQQIADVVPNDEQIDVIQYCVRGATKVSPWNPSVPTAHTDDAGHGRILWWSLSSQLGGSQSCSLNAFVARIWHNGIPWRLWRSKTIHFFNIQL